MALPESQVQEAILQSSPLYSYYKFADIPETPLLTPQDIHMDEYGYPKIDDYNINLFLKAMGARAQNQAIKWAIQFGLVKPFWTLEHYERYAAQFGKYCTIMIWAEQGSGKSNRLLQEGYWILKDWDLVLKSLVFKPKSFVDRLKAVSAGHRIPWLGWDDLGVHLPSSVYRTDLKMYEAIDSAWAAIRVKCSVITLSIPLIDRTAKAIKDNISHEVFLGPNQTELVERLVRLPSFRDTESILTKICIEGPSKFSLTPDSEGKGGVPTDVFREYWEMRLQLTEEAIDNLGRSVDEDSTEGYVSALDASNEVGISVGSLAQYVSRGLVEGKKIRGILHLSIDALEQLKKNQAKAKAARIANIKDAVLAGKQAKEEIKKEKKQD